VAHYILQNSYLASILNLESMSFKIKDYLAKSNISDTNLDPELLAQVDQVINKLILAITQPKPNIENPTTADDFKNVAEDYIKDSGLGSVYPPGDPIVAQVCKNAETLLKDPQYPIDSPPLMAKAVRTVLYDIALYCDDSSSMKRENRAATQVTFARRLADIVLPLRNGAISLRFINAATQPSWDKMKSSSDMEKAVQSCPLKGDTEIGRNMKSKILEPMLYEPIRSRKYKPLLVCVITDGWPDGEPDDLFRQVCVESKQEVAKFNPLLAAKGIYYVLNQVGTAQKATNFLQGLKTEATLRGQLYVTSEKLEQQLATNDTKAQSEWILNRVSALIANK